MLLKDAQGQTLYRSPHWPRELDASDPVFVLDAGSPTSGVSTNAANAPASAPADFEGGPGRGGGGWGRGFGGMGRGGGPRGAVVFTRTPKFLTATAGASAWRVGVLGNEEMTLVIGLNYEETQRDLNHLREPFSAHAAGGLVPGGLGRLGGRRSGFGSAQRHRGNGRTRHGTGLDQRIPESSGRPRGAARHQGAKPDDRSTGGKFPAGNPVHGGRLTRAENPAWQ